MWPVGLHLQRKCVQKRDNEYARLQVCHFKKCVKSVQSCPSIPWQSVGVAARAVRVENAACQNLRGRLLNILVWDHVLYGQWQIVAVYRIDFRWPDFRSCPALVAIAALSSSEVSRELDANRHGVPFTLQLRLITFFGSIWLYAFQLLLQPEVYSVFSASLLGLFGIQLHI